MNPKEQLITVLEGGTADKTPLSFYSWMVGDPHVESYDELMSDQWRRLYDMGLVICHHCKIVKKIEHNVKNDFQEQKKGSDVLRIHKKQTPAGTIQQVSRNGWVVEHWLKQPDDYKVMTWIVKNTELTPCYEEYQKANELINNYGIAVILASRAPAMTMNVDFCGTQQFCIDLASKLPEMGELYQALREQFVRETKLIAKGPGRYVKWLENLTANILGPNPYRELIKPIYEECVPTLENADKRVMVHYDGALRCIADDIISSPFHIIESLTEPPEGDMMYDECRKAWPDKVLWANINVELFYLQEKKLRQAIINKRNRAGKKAFAFEISEDVPDNWQESIPIVFETLKKLD